MENTTRASKREWIDEVISNGKHVVAAGFEEKTFNTWKLKARDCLERVLGPDHYYARSFKDCVRRADGVVFLAAEGLLMAARELALD
jgi:hypothetical protein